MLGIVTILIMLVTDCTCQDDRCDGGRWFEFKSAEKATLVVYLNDPSPYGTNMGANYIWHHREFTTGIDSVESILITNLYNYSAQIRLPNGWSDIGLQSAMINTSYVSEQIDCPDSPPVDDVFWFTSSVDSLDISRCKTPPTRMHLVFDSIRDFTVGTYLRFNRTQPASAVKAKVWEIDSLLNDQGQDIRSSSNWACFADNIYAFLNTGEVEYNQGDVLCDTEPDRNGAPYYIAYTVAAQNPMDHDNPGEITITLHAGGWIDGLNDVVFKVEKSDFNRISGTVEKDGETAHFVIRPQ